MPKRKVPAGNAAKGAPPAPTPRTAQEPAPALQRHWVQRYPVIPVALVALVAVVFLQTGQFEFVNYDDTLYIVDNTHTQAGLTWQNLVWAFTTGHASNWHPITWLSHMLDIQLFGMNAGAHHLVNVLFHALNAVLLFYLLKRMTGAFGPSAFVAALFAVHPLHVESVAWIAERKDVLSTLFWLLTTFAYVAYTRGGRLYYLAVLGLYAAGLMTKPMLVTLPATLLLLDYWPLKRFQVDDLPFFHARARARNLNRDSGPSGGITITSTSTITSSITSTSTSTKEKSGFFLLLEKVPLLVLAIASSIVTYLAQQAGKSVAALDVLPFSSRAGNAVVSYVKYILMAVFPHGLAVFYPHPGPDLPVWQVIAAALILIILTTGVILYARRYPYLLTGWFWYLGTLLPVIGIIQVGAQALADRYTYVSLIGLFIIAAWGLRDFFVGGPVLPEPALGSDTSPGFGKTGLLLAVAETCVVLVLAACAMAQTSYWHDSIRLFTHTLQVTTKNHLAHKNYGVALANKGQYAAAIDQYAKALKIQNTDADLYYNVGNALVELKRPDEAIAQFRKATQIKPTHAEAHYNLANALAKKGDFAPAIDEYNEVLKLQPDHVGAQVNLGNALAISGRPAEAAPHYLEAVRLDPKAEDPYINLGNAYSELGKMDEAIGFYKKALELKPNHVEARCNMGMAFLKCGKTADAVAAFSEVLRIDPGNAKARDTLKKIQGPTTN